MSKTLSILGVCAIIAGASAYAMYGNVESKSGCQGCNIGHVNATVEPACGHSHDDATDCSAKSCCASKVTVATAAKATCCATPCAACAAGCDGCPLCAVDCSACCGGAGIAVAGPAVAAMNFVSTVAAKPSCCATPCADCAAGCDACPLCAIDCAACCGSVKAAAKAVK